ncbi:hypothetical protein NK6_698 [Bradyrhizobium diazoefficiens]|uniref:Uncharacterized protein n=1 Tax=Bradyrhizobium diazoefficiens TaxID=1355477 RepID=A0A0E4BJR1_9BRAD|nr:hypothetical protein NK6_698 [Bradyrhizobium diazoefficiens]
MLDADTDRRGMELRVTLIVTIASVHLSPSP